MIALIANRYMDTNSHEYRMQLEHDKRQEELVKNKKMDNKKFYKDLVVYNNPLYNYNKLNEELAELLHVTTKMVSKNKDNKPSLKLIAEEAAHVLLRIHVLAEAENIYTEIEEEFKRKKDKLLSYMEEGKYKGGI
jgi:hypothetical protein